MLGWESNRPTTERRLDHLFGDANVNGLPTYDGDFGVGLEACRIWGVDVSSDGVGARRQLECEPPVDAGRQVTHQVNTACRHAGDEERNRGDRVDV